MKAFVSAFRIVGVLSFSVFVFFYGFLDIWPKCVPGHSQYQFYQTYWVENCTARFFGYKSWEEDLPRLIITSSYKLECFLTIFENFKIFRKLLKWLVPDWKRKIGLKIGHAPPRIARYTVTSSNWSSDCWMSCRWCTDLPYHRISIDSVFYVQPKTFFHSAELSSSLFWQRCINWHQKD